MAIDTELELDMPLPPNFSIKKHKNDLVLTAVITYQGTPDLVISKKRKMNAETDVIVDGFMTDIKEVERFQRVYGSSIKTGYVPIGWVRSSD